MLHVSIINFFISADVRTKRLKDRDIKLTFYFKFSDSIKYTMTPYFCISKAYHPQCKFTGIEGSAS